MFLKNISRSSFIWAFLIIFAPFAYVFSTSLTPDDIHNANAEIKIVYPKDDQIVYASDSTFIFGNVPAEDKDLAYILFINESYVKVYPDGGFIAFLPIAPGNFSFQLDAYLVKKRKYQHLSYKSLQTDIQTKDVLHHLSKQISIKIPEPEKSIPIGSLQIKKEIDSPNKFIALQKGERLQVTFQGTPEGHAWFSIPDVVDSVPMVETIPITQSYWGESIFGHGAKSDSFNIKGIYTGFYKIPYDAYTDSSVIHYFLAPPSKFEILRRYLSPPYAEEDNKLLPYLAYTKNDFIDTVSSYYVSINDSAFPFTVLFSDSVQIIRYAPGKGYFSIFQPEGVEALAIGAKDDWYKIQLSQTQFAWVNKKSVKKLPYGILPPTSYLSTIRYYNMTDKVIFEFPLSGKHPFRIIEDDQRHIRIQLFGVVSNTDWIRYDFSDSLINLARWSQPEENLYELNLKLNQNIWGYDTYYQGNNFYFQINKPPKNLKKIKGKIIVIDPGHSSDPGAIGPTGLKEADANLGIALALRDELVSKGAKVVMTRSDTSNVPLYDRPAIAKANNADLFVSVHNNALPDGINPFVNNGTSTYYYHPHSLYLARAIQGELTKTLKLGDYGLYHGNLAVDRPTQYPAVLVECDFIILPQQEALLRTNKFRKKIADGIAKGIEKFLKDFERNK